MDQVRQWDTMRREIYLKFINLGTWVNHLLSSTIAVRAWCAAEPTITGISEGRVGCRVLIWAFFRFWNWSCYLALSKACLGRPHPMAHAGSDRLPRNVHSGRDVALQSTSTVEDGHYIYKWNQITQKGTNFFWPAQYLFLSNIPWTQSQWQLACCSTKSGSQCPGSRLEVMSVASLSQPEWYAYYVKMLWQPIPSNAISELKPCIVGSTVFWEGTTTLTRLSFLQRLLAACQMSNECWMCHALYFPRSGSRISKTRWTKSKIINKIFLRNVMSECQRKNNMPNTVYGVRYTYSAMRKSEDVHR